MSDQPYTFQQAVHAIDRATLTGLAFPRSFRDNHPISRLLCIDWHTEAGRDGWLDYFGAKLQDSVGWAQDWHGWTVLMTAHFSDVEDSGPVGTEQRHGSPPADPGTALLAEGEAAAADLWGDACLEASARRIHGLHRAADLDNAPWAMAALTPDAAIDMPCGQSTRHETHQAHTRHVGACSRYCLGWDAPTVQFSAVTA